MGTVLSGKGYNCVKLYKENGANRALKLGVFMFFFFFFFNLDFKKYSILLLLTFFNRRQNIGLRILLISIIVMYSE